MWNEELKDLLSRLTKEEEQVLKRTILKGNFGSDICRFRNSLGDMPKKETRCWVYMTNYQNPSARRFYYKKTEDIFKSIRAKLCPLDDNGHLFVYQQEWWGESTSDISVFLKTFTLHWSSGQTMALIRLVLTLSMGKTSALMNW